MTVWAKTDMFTYKLKFLLLSQLIATLTNHAYSLPSLANVDWSAFPECFLPIMWIHDWWNGANGGIQFCSGNPIWLPLTVHVCLGLVVENSPFMGTCTHHSYSKLYYCVILLLCLSFCHHLSHLHPLPYICWPILINSI